MIRMILVPLDGSVLAEDGLGPACALAQSTGATLLLLRAVLYLGASEEARSIESAELREARGYLATIRQRLTEQGFRVQTEILPGDAVRAILFATEAHDVDLISMATHGRSGLQLTLVGSVVETVLRGSHVPMLITNSRHQGSRPAARPLRRIMVALDGSALAETAIDYLQGLGLAPETELLLVRIVPPAEMELAPLFVPQRDLGRSNLRARQLGERQHLEAEGYLRAVADRLHGLRWAMRVESGTPEEVIPAVAQVEGVDILALATRGRHGMDRLLHGSVAQTVMRQATVPVLLLHGGPAPSAGVPLGERSLDEAARRPLASG